MTSLWLAGPRDLSCPAAGCWQELIWSKLSSGIRLKTSDATLCSLRNDGEDDFQKTCKSRLLFLFCRAGSLAVSRPSLNWFIRTGVACLWSWRTLVCMSLLVLVCEVVIQDCCVFFSLFLSSFCSSAFRFLLLNTKNIQTEFWHYVITFFGGFLHLTN